MKNESSIAAFVFGCVISMSAGAQTAPPANAQPAPQSAQPIAPQATPSRVNWQVVEQLALGTAISVKGKGRHRFACKFVGATADTLDCQAETLPGPNLFPPPVFHFHRTDVRQVQLEHPRATGVIAAAVIGGVLIGLTTIPRSGPVDPLGALMVGGLGAAIAGGIGHSFPVHGRVIYQP
jgi:hypothetical protein